MEVLGVRRAGTDADDGVPRYATVAGKLRLGAVVDVVVVAAPDVGPLAVRQPGGVVSWREYMDAFLGRGSYDPTGRDQEIARLHAVLLRGPTPEEAHREAVSLASYQAFAAGVAWGAEHGLGEWDDAAQAWSDWLEGER
jgi:hypothetical protein